jgi:SAM-dependent methyltransferase
MRAIFERTVPEAQSVEGTSEAIPLDDEVADAITAAQAFHWFDPARALPEIHRVLRHGAGVALIWNVRDRAHPLHRAYAELLKPYRGGTYPEQEQHGDALAVSPLFGDVERRDFRHVQLLDADGLVARAESVSFVAQLPEQERAALLERVRALAPAGEFEFPYVTKVFTARSR